MPITSNPTQVQLPGWRGTAISFGGTYWLTAPVGETPGVPENITGWVFMFTVKKAYTDSDNQAVYKKDWTIGGTDGPNGVWFQEIPDTTTKTMPGGTYYWDIHVIEIEGAEPLFFMGGTVVILDTVTQRIVPSF